DGVDLKIPERRPWASARVLNRTGKRVRAIERARTRVDGRGDGPGQITELEAVGLREVEDTAAIVGRPRNRVRRLKTELLAESAAEARLSGVIVRAAFVHERGKRAHVGIRPVLLRDQPAVRALNRLEAVERHRIEVTHERKIDPAGSDVAQIEDRAAPELSLNAGVPLHRVRQWRDAPELIAVVYQRKLRRRISLDDKGIALALRRVERMSLTEREILGEARPTTRKVARHGEARIQHDAAEVGEDLAVEQTKGRANHRLVADGEPRADARGEVEHIAVQVQRARRILIRHEQLPDRSRGDVQP